MKLEISSEGMKPHIFKSVKDAAKTCGIKEFNIRTVLRSKRSSLTRRKDKKVFSIDKIPSKHEGDEFKIEINGKFFPTFSEAAERFDILPGTIHNAIRRGNSIIVRREDKKILGISLLSKRKFKPESASGRRARSIGSSPQTK